MKDRWKELGCPGSFRGWLSDAGILYDGFTGFQERPNHPDLSLEMLLEGSGNDPDRPLAEVADYGSDYGWSPVSPQNAPRSRRRRSGHRSRENASTGALG
jgi:hypothetical protein